MRLGNAGFLAIAIIFHLVYIYSIFDIYFVSPVSHGMQEHSVDAPAPADRVVLFVGDGLRADKAFQRHIDPSPDHVESPGSQSPIYLAPFLRSIVLEQGTFGVSHTRVPTESRPGHVALIAGLYEDVSAVTTGWKANPVHFDSVFNRSRHTWSWGSPDIIPMFADGAVPGRVDGFTYPPEAEDFSKDSTQLDYWVFDKVKDMFAQAKHNATLDAQLRQDKNVFFLHLLGLDTAGHAYRPYSQEYLHNIKVVDQGVREITQLVNDFFDDDRTAFVFTADHGMSDWGSHGDGHPDNTRTPLIVWGSGVARPQIHTGLAPGHQDGFSSDWNLDTVQRNDVSQADIAALMAYLAGLSFPVNSVGELPLPYLSASESEKARAMLVNAKVILEMYKVKERQKMSSEIRYQPFRGFTGAGRGVDAQLQHIEQTIADKEFAHAIEQSTKLCKLGLEGLRYLQTYDWLFLRLMVTLGYLGWVCFSFTIAIDQNVLASRYHAERSLSSTMAFSSVLFGLAALLYVKDSPITYYAYAVFPIVFWEEVYARRNVIRHGFNHLTKHESISGPAAMGLQVLVYVLLLETMVQSYYNRQIYTPLYMLISFWPWSHGSAIVTANRGTVWTWTLSCLAMSAFTMLPAIKVESIALINTGGCIMLIIGVLYLAFESRILAISQTGTTQDTKSHNFARGLIGVQIGLIALAMIVTTSSVASLQAKEGLPLGTQMTGWLVLIVSLLLPVAHGLLDSAHYLQRMAVIFFAFSPMFIILSISYEALFYIAYACTLMTWVRLEHRIFRATHALPRPDTPAESSISGPSDSLTLDKSSKGYRTLTLADTRIALFFFFFLQSGFFSTGNIASISSFSLDAVYRLIPVFDPFSQGALLILKILAPFVLVSANLGILTKRMRLRGGALFTIVMGITDWLTLRFFWSVKDEGSWLEIGESISVFAIASTLCIFVASLEVFSHSLVKGVAFPEDKSVVAGAGKQAAKHDSVLDATDATKQE